MFKKLFIIFVSMVMALLPAAPVFAAVNITTGSAVDITATSAILKGTLASLDAHEAVLIWFEYGTSSRLEISTTQQKHSNPGAISTSIAGLHPGTTYHYRAVALAPMPGAQPIYGAVVTFMTRTPSPPQPPPLPQTFLEVSTGKALNVTGNSAHLNGVLNATGGHGSILVWFDWGASTDYGTSTTRQRHTAPGSFSFPLSGLVSGTTYHFRAAAIPEGMVGVAPVYGEDTIFTTEAAPTLRIVTGLATDVTSNSATIGGNLTSLGPSNAIVDVWFEWGTTTAYGNRTTGKPKTKTAVFTTALTGLNGNTIYHYRAVAQEQASGGSTVYGNDRVFTSIPQPGLNVVTGSASTIAGSSAYLNGDLTLMGQYQSVDVWFEWGTTTAYATVSARQVNTKPGAFSAPIAGLYSGTTYHFRAVAQSSVPGAPVVYGTDRSFTAAPRPVLTVVTEPATSMAVNSAFINGDLTSIGEYNVAEAWFEWGITTGYGNATRIQKLPGSTFFNASLGNLNAGTTYHFRAVARGEAPGAPVVYGYNRSFTTKATPALEIATISATGIEFTSVYLNGDLISLGQFTPIEAWFEWGPDIGYGNLTPRQSHTSPIDYSAPISGLNPGTIYHFRAVVRPSMPGAQPVYGDDMMFTTAQALALKVGTEPATDVNGTSATLNGELYSLGDYSTVQVSFHWGGGTDYGNSTDMIFYATPADFSVPITGLSPGVTYHYRVAASGATPGAPTVYGSDMVFTTGRTSNPLVVTESADRITTMSAMLNGELLFLGNLPSLPVYFEWGSATAYGNITPTRVYTEAGDFSAQIVGLNPNSTYHYRAVAFQNSEPVYGKDMVFTTMSVPVPKPRLRVSAAPVSSVTATTATLSGTLDSLGNYNTAVVYFEWGRTTAYGTTTPKQHMLSAPVTFTSHLTGLAPGVTYYYRAVAVPVSEAAVFSDGYVFTTPLADAPFDVVLSLEIIIAVLVLIIIIVLVMVLKRRS
ncbi:hypothetical protein ACFLXL_02165 [Chloroflexota bacterium]